MVSQLDAASEAIHQRILLYNNSLEITKLLYCKVLKPTLSLVLRPTQQFLLDTLYSNL